MAWLMIGLGLVILLAAGDFLVRGAVNLALRMGVPTLLVSMTVVAFGTSAPELLIVIAAIRDGAVGLALGNVVGSNTANVWLVLGIPALIAGLDTRTVDTRRSYTLMIAATLLFMACAFIAPLMWGHGVLFLAVLVAILWYEAATGEAEDLEEADAGMPSWKVGMYLILGLIGLPVGADILVDNAIIVAQAFGVRESIIGLTLIAVGTSLPELSTTVMAAVRRQAGVALGNVIGSNLFNLLGVVGVAALWDRAPITMEQRFLDYDLWVMLAASLMLALFVFSKLRLSRVWGCAFVALYAAYMITLF